MIRGLMSLVIIAVSFSGIFANNNERGIDLYLAELYDAAKFFFLEQENQSMQEQLENYYYLGQTYNALQQIDSADYYYTKAIEIDGKYPLGYVGEGGLALAKGDVKTADALFKKASGLAKKDPSVQVAIAETYLNANMEFQAKEILEKARKINKKYPAIYLIEGSILMKNGKIGEACSCYENAIAFDEYYKLAYLRLAQVYKEINVDAALKYLEKLVSIDSEYIPAYTLIGEINRNEGMYPQALCAYEKLISISGIPILQHERYAQVLYFTDQYQQSLQQIDYVLKQDPQNLVMHRLQAYNNFKLENYDLSLAQLTTFLQKYPESKHIYLDYITYGRLLVKFKQSEDAITAFVKAVTLDSTKSEIYKELANAYELIDNYPEVVKQYEKYFEIEKRPVVFDYFYYGKANYLAAAKYIDTSYLAIFIEPEQKQIDDDTFNAYISKGNTAFSEVISRSPESYIGYLWKARLNSFVDSKEQKTKGAAVQGVAKPYYEEALEVMLKNNEDGKRNKEIIESYRYLASYYLLLDDKINAGEYYKKILSIDSEDAIAKDVLKTLNIKY